MESNKSDLIPIWEVALVFVVTFFVFLFVSAAILFTAGEAPTLVAGELLIMIVPLIYLLSKRVNVRNYVRLDLKPRYFLIGLGCGGLLLVLNLAVSDGLTAVLGQSQAVQQSNTIITDLSASTPGFAAVIASLALAGVCEEFAFRGFLQNSVFRGLKENAKYSRFALLIAILVSAGVFGLFHFDPQGVYALSAFVSGLALGYIYYKWNYTTSATAHASMNLIVLALLLLGH